MTDTPVLEQLDLPTGRTQQPELGLRDLGLVKHQRDQLVRSKLLPGWLHDDQAARVAEPTATAFAIEERDQAKAVAMVTVSLVPACGIRVSGPLSCRVSTAARGRQTLC